MANRLLEWNLNYIAAGQLCTNVTHWLLDSAETNLWTLAKTFIGSLTSPFAGDPILDGLLPILSEDCFLSSSTARVLLPTPGTKAVVVYAINDLPGLWADEIYAQSVAGVVKLVTASGPDYTGRTFFPAVPEEAILNGRFTDDYRTAMNGCMASFAAGVETAEGAWMQQVLKRSNNTYEAVTNRQFNANPGTIRKRLLPV